MGTFIIAVFVCIELVGVGVLALCGEQVQHGLGGVFVGTWIVWWAQRSQRAVQRMIKEWHDGA